MPDREGRRAGQGPQPDQDRSSFHGIVIAGTHSGVGKTTITLGLIGALRRRGLTVQPFKVGPDFIDPLHHGRASGRVSRNLDGWMLSEADNRRRFAAGVADADVAVVEGVMGLFDGSEGASDRGSAAEMARLLGLPVMLVVDAGAMARSAAALIHGFVTFDPRVQIAGVILNNVGGEVHADMIRDAVGSTTPVVGALPRVPDLVMPERHLGLHLPHEARATYIDEVTALVESHIDLDRLLQTSEMARPRPTVADQASPVTPARPNAPRPAASRPQPPVRIGVARDEAFCFYYADNLELLEGAGAELIEFSPMADPLPDDLSGLYIGGGYPELHAAELATNEKTRGAIRDFAARGGPVYAECGGLMYLAERLELDSVSYPFCGVLPFSTRMPAPLSIAYVQVTTSSGLFGSGQSARGHLFHHSAISGDRLPDRCYQTITTRGEQGEEGYAVANVLASYIHLHFASNPRLAIEFVQRCAAFRMLNATPTAT
jgi:cobyrinic acid a,c-diamide synthase